jgi:hypothetical protein
MCLKAAAKAACFRFSTCRRVSYCLIFVAWVEACAACWFAAKAAATLFLSCYILSNLAYSCWSSCSGVGSCGCCASVAGD